MAVPHLREVQDQARPAGQGSATLLNLLDPRSENHAEHRVAKLETDFPADPSLAIDGLKLPTIRPDPSRYCVRGGVRKPF